MSHSRSICWLAGFSPTKTRTFYHVMFLRGPLTVSDLHFPCAPHAEADSHPPHIRSLFLSRLKTEKFSKGLKRKQGLMTKSPLSWRTHLCHIKQKQRATDVKIERSVSMKWLCKENSTPSTVFMSTGSSQKSSTIYLIFFWFKECWLNIQYILWLGYTYGTFSHAWLVRSHLTGEAFRAFWPSALLANHGIDFAFYLFWFSILGSLFLLPLWS